MANLAWPSDLGYATVEGRILYLEGDSSDQDRDPDLIPASGTVYLEPSVKSVRYGGVNGPSIMVKRMTKGVLDSEGYLCTPGPDGVSPGERGLVVPATDSENISPTNFTYRVTVSAGSWQSKFSIHAPAGTTVDLAKAVPVAESGGTAYVVDESIAVRAEAAATYVEAAVENVDQVISDYLASNPDLKGERGDTGRGIASISDPDDESLVTITYTDGTTSTVQAIKGDEGHSPEITWSGTALVIDGEQGPDLKGDPGEGGGGIAGAVPIFATLEEAQAWEAAHPGGTALYLGEGGAEPEEPGTPGGTGGPTDFKHQFLGSGVTAFAWSDAKGGLSLPKEGTGSVPSSSGAASLPGTVSYGPATIPFTGEPTITAVVRVTGTAYAFLAGHPIDHAVTAPSGNGDYTIGNVAPSGPTKPAGEWQIVTARWGKPGVTQRAITVGSSTAVGTAPKEPPTSMDFRIGGVFNNAFRFTGDIREIRVYDRRLTDEEVYELHNALSSQYGIAL